MKTILHLSDMHFGEHEPAIVAAVEEHLDRTEADYCVLAGDFTQWASDKEFELAAAWTEKIRERGHKVMAVPGNHDVPSINLFERVFNPDGQWEEWMGEDKCPWFEDDGMAMLGLNTARGLVIKNGEIDAEQIAHMKEKFAGASDDALRVLVVHHPMFELPRGDERSDAIKNQEAAVSATDDAGVDLILSGHNHTSSVHRTLDLPKGDGSALVIQAGTAFSTRIRTEPPSFNIIRANRFDCSVKVLGWDGDHYVDRRQHRFVRDDDEAHWQPTDASAAEVIANVAKASENAD
nr:metallophosphoesterase [Sphingomicrobium sp. B8]